MRINRVLKALALAMLLALASPGPGSAQQTAAPQDGGKEKSGGAMNKVSGDKASAPQEEPQKQKSEPDAPKNSDPVIVQEDKPAAPSNVPADLQAGRREQLSEEEAAIVPYYNNFLKDYRLGPEDVISVDVFNQPRYSKANITVPPDGRISFPLISEGIRVVGKTTQQVQEEIQKRLDEYIIDPQVTVYLDKAMSARYSVLGDVGQPGVKIMTRRVSVMEALAEAGGVLNTGDKKKIVILRRKADGTLNPILVNVSNIEKGKAREMAYLAPGDQVIVPGNRLKSIQQLLSFVPMLSFGRIFGLPF
jgi:polysaccharide biosynthesis/export protein